MDISFQSNAIADRLSQYLPETLSEWQSIAVAAVLAAGGFSILSCALNVLRALLSIFIIPGKSLQSFGSKGSWAVVTGASDGIGKQYALQLAQAGFNIILVSRSTAKLAAVAQEIEANGAKKGAAVQTKTFSMDFTANDDDDYDNLKALIQGLDISILINNVGLSHSIPTPFVQTPEEEMEDIITINCLGTLRVTQLVTPGMVQRKRGLILTMGSFGGLFPTPLLATYSGSKAFLQQWSSALAGELAPHGIHVEFVLSYLVTSAMSKIRRSSLMIPNPKAFVSATLSSIGRSGGISYASTSVPYWTHALMAWGINTFLGPMSKTFRDINKSTHESIRKRALRKMEREQGKKAT